MSKTLSAPHSLHYAITHWTPESDFFEIPIWLCVKELGGGQFHTQLQNWALNPVLVAVRFSKIGPILGSFQVIEARTARWFFMFVPENLNTHLPDTH